MSPVEKQRAASGVLPVERGRNGCLLVCLCFLVPLFFACGSPNSASIFDSLTGQHPENWANPLAIGHTDFHSDRMKIVQSDSRAALLFGMRCALCHGSGGVGKIGPDIRSADGAIIASAIAIIPIMKGQADLSPDDIQAIAAYLATFLAGAQPATSVIQTENCTSCHGSTLDGGIARISCFSCHNGPDGIIGHPAAWSLTKSDPIHYHGSYGRKFSGACTTCHGANFDGAIGQPCALCHNGNVAPVLDFIPAAIQPSGQAVTIFTSLRGNQETPPVLTAGSGAAKLTIDLDTGAISGAVVFLGLTSRATASHIHQGAAGVNGPVIIPLVGGAGGTSGTWTVPAGVILTAAQLTALKANALYVNIHTVNNPAGEIRGQIIFVGP